MTATAVSVASGGEWATDRKASWGTSEPTCRDLELMRFVAGEPAGVPVQLMIDICGSATGFTIKGKRLPNSADWRGLIRRWRRLKWADTRMVDGQSMVVATELGRKTFGEADS